jgi:hypothetical protein
MEIICLHCRKNPTEDQVMGKTIPFNDEINCFKCELCKTMTRKERIEQVKRSAHFNKIYSHSRTGYFDCSKCIFGFPDWSEDTEFCSLTGHEVIDEIHVGYSPDNCPLKHWRILNHLDHREHGFDFGYKGYDWMEHHIDHKEVMDKAGVKKKVEVICFKGDFPTLQFVELDYVNDEENKIFK